MHYLVLLVYTLILTLTSMVQADVESSYEKAFTYIYENKVWGVNEEGEGFSGAGSTLEQTSEYRKFLQKFLADKEIKSVVDYGCGDWTFSKTIDWSGTVYTGVDVVKSVLDKNRVKYGTENIQFIHSNGSAEGLPQADLILCKDVLQHLPHEDILLFISQLHKYKYALITNDLHNPYVQLNSPIALGGYRPLDITLPPFSVKAEKVCTFIAGCSSHQVLLIDNTTSYGEKTCLSDNFTKEEDSHFVHMSELHSN